MQVFQLEADAFNARLPAHVFGAAMLPTLNSYNCFQVRACIEHRLVQSCRHCGSCYLGCRCRRDASRCTAPMRGS